MKLPSLHQYLQSPENQKLLLDEMERVYEESTPDNRSANEQAVASILSREPQRSDSSLVVREYIDEEDGSYLDASLLNKDYVRPYPPGEPFGGDCDNEDDHPEGCYNVNWKGYQEVYGFGLSPWKDVIYCTIEVDPELTQKRMLEAIYACVFWELTFYGTEEESTTLSETLQEMVETFKKNSESFPTYTDALKSFQKNV